MNSNDLEAEDIILDETFQDYVLHANPEAEALWQNWLAANPHKQDEFNQAVALLTQLVSEQEQVPVAYKAEGLKRLLEVIHNPESAPISQETVVWQLPLYRKPWVRVAAAISGLILLSLIARFVASNYFNAVTQNQTAYGKTESIILPDQSTVILNGNTTIRYAATWTNNSPREVWLEGEAYFAVEHKANHQKFMVHTADGFDIEVLGTKFSVADRKSHNRVVLNTGKVKVQIRDNGRRKPTQLILKPGELVQFGTDKSQILRKKVDAEMYSAWKDNVLVFEDTPLNEIASTLEEGYGLRLEIQDATLSNIKVTGATSTTDLIGFLKGLAKLHNLIIKQVGSNIYIGKKTPV